MLVSFSCAMQVQTFRKVQGYGYASTMCIGNLRSGTESLSQYFRSRDKAAMRKALSLFGIILFLPLVPEQAACYRVCLESERYGFLWSFYLPLPLS